MSVIGSDVEDGVHELNIGTESAETAPALVAAREGPEEAFHEFVAVRWSALLRSAYLLTGDYDRAEDLVQSALVRVHRHWTKVQRAGSPDAYVRKVMVNLNTD